MDLLVHEEAEQDLVDAAAWYAREGSLAVAARFVAAFKRLGHVLLEQPGIGAPRSGGKRAMGLRGFPYTVIYRVDGKTVHVLVVKHDRRRPGFGAHRR